MEKHNNHKKNKSRFTFNKVDIFVLIPSLLFNGLWSTAIIILISKVFGEIIFKDNKITMICEILFAIGYYLFKVVLFLTGHYPWTELFSLPVLLLIEFIIN